MNLGSADYDEILAHVVSVLGDVLQESVTPNDNFFLLGGTSLQAAHAAARLSRTTGRSVTLVGVMAARSAGVLAAWICNRPALDRLPDPAATPNSHRLMSFQQEWHIRRDAIRPNPGWRINFGYHLTGTPSGEKMRSAIDQILLRHEVLRSRFFIDDTGAPVQDLSDFKPGLGITTAPQPTQSGGLEVLREFFSQPFDRGAGDVFHASLMRHSDQQWTLAFSIDHVAFDFVSAAVLLHELSVLYNSPASSPTKLPEVRQFWEYSAWQHALVESAEGSRLRSFWQAYLAGSTLPALAALQKRGPGPADVTRLGSIEQPLVALIGRLAQQEEVTPYAICLTALILLLDAVVGQRDYVVLSPVAQRDLPEFENVIGFMAHVVPVRTQWSAGSSLRGLLRIAKSAAVASFAHSTLPFSEIKRACWPTEYVNLEPSATVFFDMIDKNSAEPLGLSGLEAAPVALSALSDEAGDADSAGISVLIYCANDLWKVNMKVSGRTFDNRWADCLLRGYVRALEQVVRHAGRSVDDSRDDLAKSLTCDR